MAFPVSCAYVTHLHRLHSESVFMWPAVCIASLARVLLFKLSNWIVEVLSLAYRSHSLTQGVRTHLTLTFLA